MAINNQIVGGGFTDLSGNPLALGSLVFQLSQDEQSATPNQIGAGKKIQVLLDSSGNVPASPAVYVYANDALNPANSFYTVWAYTAKGQLVWGPQQQQVLSSPSPFNLDVWVPNSVNTSSTPAPTLTLQTNEVQNGSQSLLDLHAGTNVTLTDNGSGRVTVAATGGVDLQTNSSDNPSQTKLNLEDTATITWAATAGGVVKATAIAVTPAAGSLTGAQAAAPSTLNLSTEGAQDWIAFTGATSTNPVFDDSQWNWKVLGGYLRRAVRFIYPGGTTTLSTNSSSTLSLSANAGDDGTVSGTASAQPLTASTNTLIETANSSSPYTNWGFSLEVPADTTVRTLRVYLGFSPSGGSVLGAATITAHLSDGSAVDAVQTISTSTSGVAWYKVTFTFNASSAGQRLNVSAMVTTYGDSGTRIGFQAATLA